MVLSPMARGNLLNLSSMGDMSSMSSLSASLNLLNFFFAGPAYEGLDTVSPAVIRLLTAVLPPGDSSSK